MSNGRTSRDPRQHALAIKEGGQKKEAERNVEYIGGMAGQTEVNVLGDKGELRLLQFNIFGARCRVRLERMQLTDECDL